MVSVAGILAHAVSPGAVENAWLIPAFPLAGAVLLLFFGRRIGRAAGPIATLLMASAFGMGLVTFFQVIGRPAAERGFVETLYRWIPAGGFTVTADYRIDPLSLVMVLVVTGVGTAIHLYSVGYMKGDPREPRYFAFLNLFAFSMLTLVLANNFLVLYLGWELVGLCSYLLIGFWFERPAAATAAKKAFIVNRVGDVSFAIGILLIFANFGTLDFGRVFGSAATVLSAGTATAIALLLFGGAAGKSAQFPLYVWLPDAMEGPTPVSALIHAATMVTAGVYVVARTGAIFALSATALDVVAWIGVLTALLAALIAFVQDDIKRVLAYSTISQLGLMFVGVGVGLPAAGIFHLVTHAFFKALLFLGAGSVMHALAGRADMTKMGGLFRKIPWTAVTMIVGWLAIIGFPGTAGFFSKDQILEGAYRSGNNPVWILGLLVTVCTGFYMSRLVFLTFFGKSRLDPGVHPHESPPEMVFPLVALALAAALGGLFGLSAESGRIQRFLAPVVVQESGSLEALPESAPLLSVGEGRAGWGASAPHRTVLSPLALTGMATGAGLLGVLAAGLMYLGRFDWLRRRERPSLAWRAARNKFGVDDLYGFLFAGVGRLAASALAYAVDLRFVDGIVNGVGTVTARLAAAGRRVQTGFVRSYAAVLLAGGVVVLGALLLIEERLR
ncbi:MAG: NADH-quinone oxidoreductase subunit L [Acidobacteria bacterium]|nr:NADH-quinone oxidoreductase subunit L [Acidobacteriota bacterium]